MLRFVGGVFVNGDEDFKPPPEDPADQENDIEKCAADVEEKIAEATGQVIIETKAVVDKVENNVLIHELEAASDANNLQDQPVQVAVADPAKDTGYAELLAELRKLNDKAKQQPDTNKQWSTARCMAFLVGGAVLSIGIYYLVTYLERIAQKQPVDDLPAVPADADAKIKALVQAWQDEPDAKFWEDLATYVEKNPGSLSAMDQALFMRVTEQMCPDDVPFLWDSEKDKAAYVNTLIAAYTSHQQSTAAMYRAVITNTYDGQPLPRVAAADVLMLALCWIYHMKTDGPGPSSLTALVPNSSGALAGRPVALVTEVRPGVDARSYARDLVARQRVPDGPGLLPWPGLGSATAPSRPHLHREAPVSAPPTTVLPLALGPGDHPRSIHSAVLAEPFLGLAPGTAVTVVRTGKATVELYHPVRIAAHPAPHHGAPAAVVGLGADWQAALKAALAVAGTLAWIMPPPWGPAASAALNLIDLLIPGSASDPIGDAVRGLETFLNVKEVEEAAGYLNDFAKWLLQLQAELDTIGHPDAKFMAEKLGYLGDSASPNGELFIRTAQLGSLLSDTDVAFPVYMLAQSLMVLTLKMCVQLQATLASQAADKDDETFTSETDAWLGSYVELLIRTQGGKGAPGCIQTVNEYIEGFCTSRLSLITEPYTYTNKGQDGWTFVDEDPGTGDDNTTHWIAGTDRTAIDAARQTYVNGIVDQLDAQFGDARKTMRAWLLAITDWRNNAPPANPVGPPVIAADAVWDGTPPPNSVWTANAQVSYAAANANAKGPSGLSAWSDWIDLKGRAHPTLTLAADPQKRTIGVQIHRQFKAADGTVTRSLLVGVSTGPGMLSYQDKSDRA